MPVAFRATIDVASSLFTDIRLYRSQKAFDILVAKNEFQVWTLTVNPDHSAILICQDGNNDKPIHSIQYRYTDFPMKQITLYFYNDTILLPTEW